MDQTRVFAETESFRYFSSQTGKGDRTISDEDLVGVTGNVGSVLDVGCGTGANLIHVVELLSASSGVGVEPGVETVSALQRRFSKESGLRFETASAHALPFESDSFDLVLCWSVLHWVGRNEYLQALGELLRVTRTWLVVMDFVGAEPYRVPYHHQEGLFTYKMDFRAPLLSSGALEVVREARWWESGNGVRNPIADSDLLPFEGNPLNYDARLACTFRKDPARLPAMTSMSFTE